MFIRTVLGDISADQLGRCYCHEHVVSPPSFVTYRRPDLLLDDLEKVGAELAQFKRDGGGAMVETKPCDCGRDVLQMAQLSATTGVHIICPTGLHMEDRYPPGHWGQKLDEQELAAIFITEIEEGIDGNDLGGPCIERTAHRAGLIKVAGSRDTLTDTQRRVMRAAAIAQQRTGAPILSHCEAGTAAQAHIDVLTEAGADPRKLILAHTDRRANLDHHRRLLAQGVCLEYDSAFRWRPGAGNPTLDMILGLAEEFPDQIVLGMDAKKRLYWTAFGGSPGLSWLLTDFLPAMLAADLGETLARRLLIDNPARVLAIGPTG